MLKENLCDARERMSTPSPSRYCRYSTLEVTLSATDEYVHPLAPLEGLPPGQPFAAFSFRTIRVVEAASDLSMEGKLCVSVVAIYPRHEPSWLL